MRIEEENIDYIAWVFLNSTHVKITGFIALDFSKVQPRIECILDQFHVSSEFYLTFDSIIEEKFFSLPKSDLQVEKGKEVIFEYQDISKQIRKDFIYFGIKID